jgi:hypothetical protein
VYHRWDQVKIVVITELVVSAYSLALLVTYLRLSFNIMGGYLCRQQTDPSAPRLAPEVQQAYATCFIALSVWIRFVVSLLVFAGIWALLWSG